MAAQESPGGWTAQDGVIIPGGRRTCHAQSRWDDRVGALDSDLVGLNVRVAWREAAVVGIYRDVGVVVREHSCGMRLISEWAHLQTCYRPVGAGGVGDE